MVSLKTHNILDYVIGVVLIIAPYLFGLGDLPASRNTFLIAGIALICYSALTNYEFSLAKIIPLGVHMVLDVIVGAVVGLAPYLFGFRDMISGGQFLLHICLGIFAIGFVALTRQKTNAPTVEYPGGVTDYRRDLTGNQL